MGNPEISRSLEILPDLVSCNENLKEPLELERDILRIQQKIEANPSRGALPDALNPESISRLQEKSLHIKKPISSLVDPSTFDSHALSISFEEIVSILAARRVGSLETAKLPISMSSHGISLEKLIDAVLKEDEPLL